MKLILDLDTGIDDAMALAYAVGSPDLELIGVTGTYGNVYTKVGVQNVLNLLEMMGKPEIPVFLGEKKALTQDVFVRHEVSARIHGENGVGQVELPVAAEHASKMDAVDFIIESVKKYGKELVIVATGPQTNLAAALNKAPEIKENMGKIVIMGGALTVPGNVSPYAEANISKDPLAAKILFESGLDVIMVGLDVTQRSQLTLEDLQAWKNCGTLAGGKYADMVAYYISQHEHSGGTACYLHDPSAAVCAVHPEWFTMLPMHMTVVTEGEAAGRTIGDPMKLREANPNVKVCIGVDSPKLEAHLKEILMRAFLGN